MEKDLWINKFMDGNKFIILMWLLVFYFEKNVY